MANRILDKLQAANKNFPLGTNTVPAAKPTKFFAPTKDQLPASSLSIKPEPSGKFKPSNASAFVD